MEHHHVGGVRVHRGEGVGDRASRPARLVEGNFLGGLDATALVRFTSCAFPLKVPGALRMSGVQKRCGSSAADAHHTGAPPCRPPSGAPHLMRRGASGTTVDDRVGGTLEEEKV
ncbi:MULTISPECIES: hypothetical protein [unclassified Streptomyces]|uniref:hypothetical protein n=1 Tax=unclassified Streptomyces TaxID=2593676 RepID=UPI002DDA3E12|nr:hypothetical protein [Streptomyces sp. NBC_01761]WSC51757.1 hypothetical protein OG808_05355 [Streptomyces sp. NBC_01761]